jgi:hypothetical protein
VERSEGKKPLERPGRRWDNNTKLISKKWNVEAIT